MITMRDRVRRPIQANLKRFIFVVVVFSLALCLLGQIALSFYCFYDSHRGVMGDEASVFLDPSLTDAQRKKAQEQIRALAPITELREIKPNRRFRKRYIEARRRQEKNTDHIGSAVSIGYTLHRYRRSG